MLKDVSIGWHWLEKTLNEIIGEVNANKPLQSASIAVEQYPNGSMLRVVAQNALNQQGQQAAASQQTAATAPPVWNNVGWQTVTVVDPATCAQSTIQVLVQRPGGAVTIK